VLFLGMTHNIEAKLDEDILLIQPLGKPIWAITIKLRSRVDKHSAIHHIGLRGGWRCAYPPYLIC
jgi:hypothetical protein